ncbi:hypothetical protein HNQ69_000963 [Bartonella callosciuri]|uniref:Uncharacterized protein n=1 Tax=Bartonella callosciuri TaxID=686223 RepID=A0A840P0L6_9HYPH|nr:hypothetical protein [Bartonella callosciuri]
MIYLPKIKKHSDILLEGLVYYATFVNAQSNYLPPDNFQEDPEPLIAHRTSPTNIGVYLLSVITARDFGWISFEEAIPSIECTLSTLEKMEKFRGHLYQLVCNRYTQTSLAYLCINR